MEKPSALSRREILWRAATSVAVMTAQNAAKGMSMSAPRLSPNTSQEPLTPVPIAQVKIDDPFWNTKRALWREVTIPDCLTKFESDRGGAIRNFDLVRDGKTGEHAGPPWYDGLIYEMLRGCADFLADKRDPALEARLDSYITRIVAAQAVDPDGYLNTYTQTMLPQTQRWGQNGGDLRWQHDVYNAGMLVEAGVHYWRATGKGTLLAVGTRLANRMCDLFGPAPKDNVVPGHSGPEEALVQLYLLYQNDPRARQQIETEYKIAVTPERYLKLAEFFLDGRGHYEGRTGKSKTFGEYGQDHAPLAKQKTLEGHAVRATLFATGITAAAEVTRRRDYHDAALRFWDSLIHHRVYISGAAGAIADDEKLGADYFLPNDGYMETCAAVGVGFFARNMNLLFGDACYIDELENALYNAVLGGVALTGNRYYYQNPLTGEDLRRWEWHDCPCCPPMFLKIMGALPGYIYAQGSGGKAVYVNLFVSSDAVLENVAGTTLRLRQTTNFPWDGKVTLQLNPEKPTEFDLMVRIPGWSQPKQESDALYTPATISDKTTAILTINGVRVGSLDILRGYARLRRKWQPGDTVELTLSMPVRAMQANPAVEADKERIALMRGPVLYCLESVDNTDGVGHLVVSPENTPSFTTEFAPDVLGGVAVVRGSALAVTAGEGGNRQTQPTSFTAVPFYASANRERGALRVWLPTTPGKAIPLTLARRSRASASHCWHLDSVAAINDGIVPERSNDTSHPRLSWWDHKGTAEWVEIELPKATTVSRSRVFWFADRTAGGGCDLPHSWRLLYRDTETNDWKPVQGVPKYPIASDRFCEVPFSPITATALRLELKLQEGWSAGICEWDID